MPIDVTAYRRIPVPQTEVAAYAMDWHNDADWTQGIRMAELTKEAPGGGFAVGAEVTRTAHFLGRRIHYVLRVEELSDQVLDMRSVAGPFPMHVTYRFHAATDTVTEASIRVQGGAGGLARLFSPLMARMVIRNLDRDLKALETRLTESATAA